MVENIRASGEQIQLLSDISTFTYLFPVALFNKFVFSRLIKRSFHLSAADSVDLVIFALSIIWDDTLILYEH